MKDKEAKEGRKMEEEKAEEMENALLKGGAPWDIARKGRNGKRDREQGGKGAKKARLEKLVGWGEEALNIREWLIGKEEGEGLSTNPSIGGTIKQQEHAFRTNIEKEFANQQSRIGLSVSVPTPEQAKAEEDQAQVKQAKGFQNVQDRKAEESS